MQIIIDKYNNINLEFDSSIALGMFDGIHSAHQSIIKKTIEQAKECNIKSVVITFDKHPDEILNRNVEDYKIIIDNYTKTQMLKSLGADVVVYLKLDKELLNLSPNEFINFLVHKLNAKIINCGFDYRFGKFAKGDVELLKKYSSDYGFKLNVLDEVQINNDKISSTLIRKYLEEGNLIETNKLLGYTYCLYGVVESGHKIARNFGYPTANFILDNKIALRNGVYATTTIIENQEYKSVTNVGIKPTFNGSRRLVETHIIGLDNNLYGKEICVKFHSFIRPEKKFDSIEELKKQIAIDTFEAQSLLEKVFTK